MNIKRTRPETQKSRLENEVILAVVILYVLLSAALLLVHHLQPDEVETKTSSTSPSHGDFAIATHTPSSAAKATAAPMSLADAHRLLADQGFDEIDGLRAAGSGFHASASKQGRHWQVQVDAATQQISAEPQAAH